MVVRGWFCVRVDGGVSLRCGGEWSCDVGEGAGDVGCDGCI